MTDFTLLMKNFMTSKRDNASHKTPIYRTDIMTDMYNRIRDNNQRSCLQTRALNSNNIPYDNNQILCDNNYAGNLTTSSAPTSSAPASTSWSFPSSGSYVGYGSEGAFQ